MDNKSPINRLVITFSRFLPIQLKRQWVRIRKKQILGVRVKVRIVDRPTFNFIIVKNYIKKKKRTNKRKKHQPSSNFHCAFKPSPPTKVTYWIKLWRKHGISFLAFWHITTQYTCCVKLCGYTMQSPTAKYGKSCSVLDVIHCFLMSPGW